MSGDWWEKLRTNITRTLPIEHTIIETDSEVVQEDHQTRRKAPKTQIEALAFAIDMKLDWQSRQLQLKQERKTNAMRRAYRDKVTKSD